MKPPYRWAIDKAWYEGHKDSPEFADALSDWMERDDPPGWAEEWAARTGIGAGASS